MRRADFHYDLPPELIAQRPLAQRAAGRLLCVDRHRGTLRDAAVSDLPLEVRPGDLFVFNDTRVIKARLRGRKETGGAVEALVERILGAGRVLAHLRASKPPQPGMQLRFAEGAAPARVVDRQKDLYELQFEEEDVLALLERHGEVPLPPYIERAPDALDEGRYQTVFARAPGAVAAPTASLHFDESLLEQLRSRGADFGFVTLHVGAGTFQPVRMDEVTQHQMHAEQVEVTEALCERVNQARRDGRRVVAVGTTVVRALESAASSGLLQPLRGETRLFITPGYRFQVVDALFTNFHLPESTLLMLVCAFGGYEAVMKAYRHAVTEHYRFFSYGDAMWLA